jgi:hypothetical protein
LNGHFHPSIIFTGKASSLPLKWSPYKVILLLPP